MHYFGERENGPPVQDQEQLTAAAWRGIVGVIQTGLRTALFAEAFPACSCVDHGFAEAITGCNEEQFYLRLQGDHPGVVIPLDPNVLSQTIPALELVEFCYRYASMPIDSEAHRFFAHRHYLYFRRDIGQQQFARDVNTIFARNHLAY